MRRILICFSYKGTAYSGLASQPGKDTIQKRIEDALFQVTRQNIKIYPSGRTDAQVHALKQYAHLDTDATISCDKLVMALNTYLPSDIRILSAKEVDSSFDARKSAKLKTYQYIVSTAKITSPFLFDYVCEKKHDYDISVLNSIKSKIEGTHNFKAFCASRSGRTNFVRTVESIEITKKDDLIFFKITGNGFLYNMVRIIVGTILDIADKTIPIENIDKMFETGERKYGGRTLCGKGLMLLDVKYLWIFMQKIK